MILIEHARIVSEKEIIPNGALLIDNGRIKEIGKTGEVKVPADAGRMDAGGHYLGPGFVDIHVHGGGGYNFFDAPLKAARHFLRHGETTVLATGYTTYTKEEYLTAMERIRSAVRDGARNIAGFYMEGPYLNPKYGAEPKQNRWRGKIQREDYAPIVDCAGSFAKVWAVAPEREGISGFMEYARCVNPDAVFSVAHSEATPEEIDRVRHYGIRLQTHIMNATGRVGEGNGVRTAGPDEYSLMNDDLYAELICDSLAIHVPAYLQKLILKVKGIEKIILITDSFATGSEASGKYAQAEDLSFDSDGNLSGSRLTMDAVCRNFMKHTQCGMVDAFLAAATNPSKLIGMCGEVGSIAVGKKANLVLVDENFHIQKVFFEGGEINAC